MKKNKDTWNKVIYLVIICLLAGSIVYIVDRCHSKVYSNENARNLSAVKERAKADREYVKITISQLRSFVILMRSNKSSTYGKIGAPMLEGDSIVRIDLSGMEKAYIGNLVGSHVNDRFKEVYTDSKDFHFRYEIVGKDTIVDCPAYILAKFVGISENRD